MESKLFRIKLYELTGLFRVPMLLLSLILFGASGWVVLDSLQRDEKAWLQGGLGLFGALAFLSCVSYLSWFFPTLRFIRWRITRQIYRSLRWLSRPGLLLAGVAAVVLVVWSAELVGTFAKQHPELHIALDVAIWADSLKLGLNLLVAVVLIAMLREIGRARRRIVVQPFLDYAVDSDVSAEARKASGEALSSLVRNEIAGIASLYKIIDEVSPSKTSVEATVGVQDVGERLKEAVGPDSKLKLFGVEIPVGSVAMMIGWMVRGPRLSGSLHKEGDAGLVMLAEIEGGGLSGSWRVHLQDIEAEDRDIDAPAPTRDEPRSRLVRQMAYRIVAHLLSVGSPRWQAVRHFTEGLRYYRDTQRTERDKVLNLCRAERAFIRALAHDQKFSQCHSNLGVVYRELGKLPSAEAAFRRALEEAPCSFEAAYGLAEERFDEDHYGVAVDCCDTAIRICPEEARAWNLKSWALRRAREQQRRRKALPGYFSDWLKRRWPAPEKLQVDTLEGALSLLEPKFWGDIVVMREVAAALAWRALCRALRKSDQPDPQTWIAAACTINSGISYCLANKSRFCANQRFWQAIHLYGDSPVLRLEMGKARCQGGDWEGAVEAMGSLLSYQVEGRELLDLLLYRMAAFDLLPAERNRFLANFDYLRLVDLACLCPPKEREFLLQSIELVEGVRRQRGEPSGGRLQHLELALYLFEGLARAKKEDPDAYIERLRRIDEIWEAWHDDLLLKEDVLARVVAHLPITGRAVCHEPEQWKDDRSAHLRHLMGTVQFFSWKRIIAHSKILLAEECLARCEALAQYREAASEAIAKLEQVLAIFTQDKHPRDLQIRKRHLYELLARAHGVLGRPRAEGAASDWSELIKALTNANQSVLREPEGPRERLSLGQAYARLGDYGQAEDELRTSWQLHPGSEVLQEIAVTGWEREYSQLDPEERSRELRRLADILEKGLDITEMEEFQEGALANNHGMVHYWLGRFRAELLDPDAAIQNLRIARAMGYKPIETSLILGQVYLDANAYGEAENAFREGLVEAHRQLRLLRAARKSRGKDQGEMRAELTQCPAPAVGEARSINDLQIELRLKWALSLAERRGDLGRALHLARGTGVRIRQANKPLQPGFRALQQEVLGWIAFQDGDWPGAIVALKASVDLQPSASAYLRLARAYLERGLRISDRQSRHEDLTLARDAARVAERTDRRKGLKSDLEVFRNSLAKSEHAGEAAGSPVPLSHEPAAMKVSKIAAGPGPDRLELTM